MNEYIKTSGLVINYSTDNSKKFKLSKQNTFKTKDDLNIFFINNPLIIKRFEHKFVEHINTFLNRIQTLNPDINLSLFYENLKTLSIKERKNFNKWIFITTNIRGMYLPKKNKIAILKDDEFFSIYHELLHCASSKKEKNSINCGFSTLRNKIGTGLALTEGYTSLLQERYFKEMYNKQNYPFLNNIASLVEIIIGKDKMESLYFRGNLNGLIKEFKKYGIHEMRVVTFLNQLDFLHTKMGIIDEYCDCQKTLYNITNFLIYCYEQKCKTSENMSPTLDEFISYFKKPVVVKCIKYRFISEDDYILGNGKIKKEYDDTNNFHKIFKIK